MKRFAPALIFVLIMAALAVGQDFDQVAEEKVVPVQVDVTVTDSNGKPLSGIMVQAQKVGRARQALTDKEGRCTLNLLSGDWVFKAIRLGAGDQLIRLEISLSQEEVVSLPIVIGDGQPLIQPDEQAPASEEIDARSLGDDSVEALAKLDQFTDLVLQESLKKIVDQLANNQFTTTYWVQDQGDFALSDDIGISSEPVTSFRLDNDWSGRVVSPGVTANRKAAVENMFASASVLSDVPVNVKFDIAPSYFTDHAPPSLSESPLAYQSRTRAGDQAGGNSIWRISSNVVRMVTGGELSPGEDMGYDLGNGENQFSSKATGFYSYYNEINNSIVNLYRPLRERYTNQNISNADTVRSIEFGVEKTFLGGLRATVFYTYSEASGLDIRTVDLYFEEWQDFENFLQNGIRHDLSTSLEARVAGTGTSLSLGYRFFINDVQDLSINETVSSLVTDYSRLNIKLQQSFGILSSAKISFNFAINNLLNSTRNTYISPTDLDEEITDSRKLLGGIKIEF